MSRNLLSWHKFTRYESPPPSLSKVEEKNSLEAVTRPDGYRDDRTGGDVQIRENLLLSVSYITPVYQLLQLKLPA
jgi:hypothetical protein